jgi:glutamate--cysteine ligase
MWKGSFGLEKESLRVTTKGYLSHTPHPFVGNKKMERDFCENQTELITGVNDSVEAAFDELSELHTEAVVTLNNLESGQEILWPFSNPPYVKGENDIPIASYSGSLKGKEIYRKYLASKYGKRKMLYSGIHFNYSYSHEMIEEGYKSSNTVSLREYTDQLYLDLAKKLTKYSWLIVYLTAASPVMDASFFPDGQIEPDVRDNLASARCSKIGYWNYFDPVLEYENCDRYVSSIEEYVKEGQLQEVSELYYPVRLKPKGDNSLERLKCEGINHIELRMLDLNPLEPYGICLEDLKFIHQLIIYLSSIPEEHFSQMDQMRALKNMKLAATYTEEKILIETGVDRRMPVRAAAYSMLEKMEQFYRLLKEREAIESIHYQKQKILCVEKRYAVQIRERFQKNYVQKGVRLAMDYAQKIEQAFTEECRKGEAFNV